MPEWRPMPEMLTFVLIVLRFTYMSGPVKSRGSATHRKSRQIVANTLCWKTLACFARIARLFDSVVQEGHDCGSQTTPAWSALLHGHGPFAIELPSFFGLTLVVQL